MPIIECVKCGRKEYQKDQSLLCDYCKPFEIKKEKRIITMWKGD
jgi:Zn ribbon nucleic-acid-binding protein